VRRGAGARGTIGTIGVGRAVTVPFSVRFAAGAATVVFALLALTIQPFEPFAYGGDLWVYLAAGERLNDAHALYALQAGDRYVAPNPPFWTTPLLAPPPIAVLWRPLAATAPLGPALWWSTGLVGTGLMTIDLLRRGGPIAVLGTVLLAPALALTAASGNVTAILTPLVYLAWRHRTRDTLTGSTVALGAALRITPALLGVWLVAHRGRRAVVAALLAAGVSAGVSIGGAGIDAHRSWIETALPAAPAPLSVSAVTGLPSIVVTIGAALVVVAVATLRRERLTFATAVVAATLASPTLYFTALASLAAALAVDET